MKRIALLTMVFLAGVSSAQVRVAFPRSQVSLEAAWSAEKESDAKVRFAWLFDRRAYQDYPKLLDLHMIRHEEKAAGLLFRCQDACLVYQGTEIVSFTNGLTYTDMVRGTGRARDTWERVSESAVEQNIKEMLDWAGVATEQLQFRFQSHPGFTSVAAESVSVTRLFAGVRTKGDARFEFCTVTGRLVSGTLRLERANFPSNRAIQWRSNEDYERTATAAYSRFRPFPSARIAVIERFVGIPFPLRQLPGWEDVHAQELTSDDRICQATRTAKGLVCVTFLEGSRELGGSTLSYQDVWLDGATGRAIEIVDYQRFILAGARESAGSPPAFDGSAPCLIRGQEFRLRAWGVKTEPAPGKQVTCLQQGKTLFAAKLSKDGRTLTIGEGKDAQTFLVPKELLGKDLVGKPFGKKD